MLEKTLGVVLCSIPYNDRTTFVHIYTERFGKISYGVTASRNRRGAAQRTMLAPLTLLQMQVQHRPDCEIQKIREAEILLSPYSAMPGNPFKTAQCLFAAELLDRAIGEVETNPALFQFIRQSIELLELCSLKATANFHLIFVIRLCYLLGFRIDIDSYTEGAIFDVSEGVFSRGPIYHPYYLQAESAAYFHRILQMGFSDLDRIDLHRTLRNRLVDTLLLYLKLHIPEMGDLHSIDVLKELFV